MAGILSRIADRAMRGERVSKAFYDEAVSERKKSLAALRNAASGEILFYYPDAKILTNEHCPYLIATAPRAGKFIVGRYVDDFFPKIRDATHPDERISAVNDFKKAVREFVEGGKRDNLASYLMDNEAKPQLRSKGFALHFTENFEINEVELSKNGTSFCRSSGWDTILPAGVLAKSLFDHVVTSREPGQHVSDLRVTVRYDAGYCQDSCASYHLYYDEFDRASVYRHCKPIADFLNVIDDQLSVPRVLIEANAQQEDDDIVF